MTRREFLSVVTATAAGGLLSPGAAGAQDVAFLRAWERAQGARPHDLTARARIAGPDEPGTPLVIHGRVVQPDGVAPAAGAIVFAYHTDREGVYDRPGTPPHSWRLRGWVRTDARGRFEFASIRPGSYPSRSTPAHVHFSVITASGERFHAGELRFQDDPLVPAREHDAATRAGEFAAVRPVRLDAGVQHVDFAIRLDAAGRF